MKKLVIILAVLLSVIFAESLFAQSSLYNNDYYKKSVKYKTMSEDAFEAGEYDKSYEYAVKSRENAALSKAYIAEMVKAYRARTSLEYAKERIEFARRVNFNNTNADVFNNALGLFNDSNQDFNSKKYEESLEKSQQVIALLKDVKGGGKVLPAFYEVVLNVNDRDCLWKIAEYDFVYGDPWKWKVLYNANKSILQDPDNPALIQPGQILKIPSIKGELREGTYGK